MYLLKENYAGTSITELHLALQSYMLVMFIKRKTCLCTVSQELLQNHPLPALTDHAHRILAM